jgi:type I restriction enzyme R subunit
MPRHHTEAAFKAAVEACLTTSGGYARGDRDAFDPELCIDAGTFLAFVRETQPRKWGYLQNLQKEKAVAVLLADLYRALNSERQGCLSVLRHGNTLDVTPGLTGIPAATAEFENPLTGRTWRDAVRQYKHDRDPAELIFQFRRRDPVHFAVDPYEVYMTTRLADGNMHFLPFNKGFAGGAGDPEPRTRPDGKPPACGRRGLERDSLLDILAHFVHLQIDEKRLGGRKVQRETISSGLPRPC